jgi:hypothetical protein
MQFPWKKSDLPFETDKTKLKVWSKINENKLKRFLIHALVSRYLFLFTPALTFLKQVLVLLSFVMQFTVGIKM